MKKLIFTYFFAFCIHYFGYSQTEQKITTPPPAAPPVGAVYYDYDCDGIGGFIEVDYFDEESCQTTTTGDCDDNDASVGVQTWYLDADGDGFGNIHETYLGCFPTSNFVSNNTDCNDNDFYINPNTKWYYDPTGTAVFDDNELIDFEEGIPYIVQCDPPGPNYTTAHNSTFSNNFNWTQTITYDNKELPTSSSRTYFDDLGKPNLSLSKDLVTSIIWGSETTYDNFGRPEKSSFTAPSSLSNLGKIGYLTSSSSYSSTTNLTNYYSDSNTQEPFQATATHPYNQTNYDVLNPGNVVSVVGGNKIGGVWKTGFSYTFPAAQEMYYLYGYDFFNGSLVGSTEEIQTKFYKTIAVDANGVENVVFSDGEGKTLASARSGTSNISPYEVYSLVGTQGFIDVHIPVGVPNASFTSGTIPANYIVYDLKTGLSITPTPTTLPSGAYRIALASNITLPTSDPKVFVTNVATGGALSTTAGAYGIKYQVNYYDFAINVYDKTDRLIKSVQPNGFKANFTTTPSTFKILANPTYLTSANFATTYKYNTLGQVIEVNSADEGISRFAYRKDGQIRYSQNANQSPSKVSYTNYDILGRPIESGVITGTSTIWTSAMADVDSKYVIAGTPSERVFSIYDEIDNVSLVASDQIPTPYSLIIPTSLSLSALASSYSQKNLAGSVAATYKADSGANINSITWYSYDIYGRVEWVVQYNDGFSLGNQVKTIDYIYDYKGNVSKVVYQKGSAAEQFIHKYSYDANDVLKKVETSKDDVTFINHAEYSYYKTGELKRTHLIQAHQGLDYVYTLGGMLKAINHPSLEQAKDPGHDSDDLFGIQLDYYSNDYIRSGTNISSTTNITGTNQDFNGNIKATIWANKSKDASNTTNPFAPVNASNIVTRQSYIYNYNRDNWLLNARYGTITSGSNTISPNDRYYEGNLSYDSNGNIITLQRKNESSTVVDDFLYHYQKTGTNRLTHIKENAPPTSGDLNDIENQSAFNYDYDGEGRLTKNLIDNLVYSYNTQGLVTDIRKAGSVVVKFYYNERGNRIKKESFVGGTLNNTTYYVYDLSGNVMSNYNKPSSGTITQSELPIYGLSRLGVYVKSSSDYANYEITDHLGNVRVVVKKVFNVGSIGVNSFADYYPFGEQLPSRVLNSSPPYKYAFQGQELDGETNMEAFQLRLWDGRIGRWLNPDPKHQYPSPYLGMGNNPLSLIDPDGGSTDDWYEKLDEYGNGTGKYEWFDGSYDIVGYNHMGYNLTTSITDINGFQTIIDYRGDTKSSYLYDSSTGKFNFLKNYDNSHFVIDFLMGYINSISKVSDMVSGSLVNGFQGGGIFLYESLINGRDMEGVNAEHLGYKPALDMTRTTIFNNGKLVEINMLSLGEQKFALEYAYGIYQVRTVVNLPNTIKDLPTYFTKATEWIKNKF